MRRVNLKLARRLMKGRRFKRLGEHCNFEPKYFPDGAFDWRSLPRYLSEYFFKEFDFKNDRPQEGFKRSSGTKVAGMRERLWQGQQGKCYYCHNPIPITKFTIDHKLPLSRGGRGGNNCVGACSTCNNAKGRMTEDEFYASEIYARHMTTHHRGAKKGSCVKRSLAERMSES